jgi:ribonuclease P protein component
MLPAPNRLRKLWEINRVYKRGVYGGAGGDLSVRVATNGRSESRVVVVVSKKVSKKAVVRNTIRRRLIGAIREMWATLPGGYDIVVNVHADISRHPVPQLHELLTSALKRTKLFE